MQDTLRAWESTKQNRLYDIRKKYRDVSPQTFIMIYFKLILFFKGKEIIKSQDYQ